MNEQTIPTLNESVQYIGDIAVTSVNGKTGDVVLGAEDVGALPDTTVIPTKVSQLENDEGFVDQDDLDSLENKLQNEIDDKQNRLIAGENITIENNVISAASTYVTITVTPSMVISENPLTLQFTANEDAIITDPSNVLIKIDATQIGVGASIFTKSDSNRTGEYVLVNNVATYEQGTLTVNNSTANVVVYKHSNMQGVYSVKDLQDKLIAGDNIVIEGNVISATGGGSDPENAYESIEEVGNADDTFMFNTSYSELDYGAAKEYFDNNAHLVSFACSAIVKDGVLGRNYDWLYNNQAEFRVETPHTGHRYATSGIATLQGLDKDFVKSGDHSELYKYLPFSMLDGQNEKGLQAAILVVPDDKGDTTGTPISGGPEEAVWLNALMLIRYALDHFATIAEVRAATQRYLSIYVPQKLRDLGYECHFIFKDNEEVYALEFDSNTCIWTDITKKPIMTNFFLTGVEFKEDGTIYKVGEEGISASGLTARSQGLERYNILLAGLNDQTMSAEDIMDSVKYTQLYKNEFQNAWVSEYAGTNGLTVFDEQVQFYNTYLEGQRAFADRSRENPVTDQTVHTAIYGDYLNIFTQERSQEFTFPIVREVYPDVYRIECADYLTIEGHIIPDITLEQMNKAIADGVIANNRTLCVSNLVAGEFYTVNMSITEGTDFIISFLYENVGIFQYTNELKTEVTTKFISFDKPNIVGYYDEDNDKFFTTSALTEEIEPKGDTLFVDITNANAPRLFLCLMSGYSYSYKEFDGGGTGGATWGSITGTLSNQTDLQAALDNVEGKIPELLGSTGQSTTAGMTQKAITDALASAGGAKTLTTADYNYPTSDPNSVALWLLDTGVYLFDNSVSETRVRASSSSLLNDFAFITVMDYGSSGSKRITTLGSAGNAGASGYDLVTQYYVGSSGSELSRDSAILKAEVVNNLTSTSATAPLSAYQGKVLKDMIGDLAGLDTTDKTNLVAAINEVAGGSGGGELAHKLTTADYNYPASSPNSIALWLLEPGVYWRDTNDSLNIKWNNGTEFEVNQNLFTTYIVGGKYGIYRTIIPLTSGGSSIDQAGWIYNVNPSNGTVANSQRILWSVSTNDNLTSTSTWRPLSANQGKVLKDMIDSLIIKGSGAPTTSTVGTVGQLYEDTTNGKLYQCTAVSGSTYTWEAVGGGSGGGDVSFTDLFTDGSSQKKVKIGNGSTSTQNGNVAIGSSAHADDYDIISIGGNAGSIGSSGGRGSISLGRYAKGDTSGYGCVALGCSSKIPTGLEDTKGIVSIGHTSASYNSYTYKSSGYRLLTGLHDGENAHDAATVAQGNTLATTAPTTATVGVLGQLYTDTTNMHTYQCTAINGSEYTWTQRW